MMTASPGCKPKNLRGSTRPSKHEMMVMRGWIGGLASRLAKGGAGLWVWANVALRERKLATRLSSVLSSAIIESTVGRWLLVEEEKRFSNGQQADSKHRT